MDIKRYTKSDEQALFNMMRRQEKEWSCYYDESSIEKYKAALHSSITYTAFCGDKLCGYVRCRDDSGFGIYVYDLLVDEKYRGNEYGKKMLNRVCIDYPEDTVYVMSDADGYYKKQGYKREGSIFIVN